jgi:hypothetical protein
VSEPNHEEDDLDDLLPEPEGEEEPEQADEEGEPEEPEQTPPSAAAQEAADRYREELNQYALGYQYALGNPAYTISASDIRWRSPILTTGFTTTAQPTQPVVVAPPKRKFWQLLKKRQDKKPRPEGAVPPEDVSAELRLATARAKSAEGDVTMKKVVGYGSLVFMLLTIAVADFVFYKYGEGNDWDIPGEVVIAWLTATVVQVAVIVRTVASYLFPRPPS